jgi:hypothetical protein
LELKKRCEAALALKGRRIGPRLIAQRNINELLSNDFLLEMCNRILYLEAKLAKANKAEDDLMTTADAIAEQKANDGPIKKLGF